MGTFTAIMYRNIFSEITKTYIALLAIVIVYIHYIYEPDF